MRRALLLAVVLSLLTSASMRAQPAERLSETEQLRYQLVAAQSQVAELQRTLGECQIELAPLRTKLSTEYVREELAKVKAAIEAAHPGYVFDVEAGTLTPKPAKERTR